MRFKYRDGAARSDRLVTQYGAAPSLWTCIPTPGSCTGHLAGTAGAQGGTRHPVGHTKFSLT